MCYIHKLTGTSDTIASVAIRTCTIKRTIGVCTCSRKLTCISLCYTFINILTKSCIIFKMWNITCHIKDFTCTGDAISNIASWTCTAERFNSVCTYSRRITVIGSFLTFINIGNYWTWALERSNNVCTCHRRITVMGICNTFINI